MISLITTPQLIQPCYNPIYTKVSASNVNLEGYNFVFDLYINNNFVVRDRLPNIPATNETTYTPASIIESFLSYDLSHKITGATTSTNCVDQYKIIYGEEYVSPWRFTGNRAITGGTYNGYIEYYSTGDTIYSTGDIINVIQDSGFTSNYYNGIFKVLSASSKSIIVDAIHSVITPTIGGLIYYSDRRKTVFTGSTQVLYNNNLIYANQGWTTYGPDGCGVKAGLAVTNKMELVVPDSTCGTAYQTVFNTATTITPGASYTVTFTVDNVNNPSGEGQAATPVIGGTFGTPFAGTGTSVQTIIAGTGTTFGMNLNMIDANTSGFGSHSMTLSSINLSSINSFSGYAFNGVVQYEDVPSWSYTKYQMVSGSTGKFLTNQPAVKTQLSDSGSIGFMNIQPYLSGVSYHMVVTTTNNDNSVNAPSVFDLLALSATNRTTNERIIEFGAYPVNLNNLSPNLINSNIKSYTIQIKVKPEPIHNPNTYVDVSEVKTFLIDYECSKFGKVRFMFLNTLGQFDYFNATLLSRETININRTTYQKTLGYNYQVGDRGNTIINVDGQQTYNVTSNWVTEATGFWLMELFLSNEVYVINDDNSLMPIIINNSSVEPIKSTNQKNINYTFEYSKAVSKNTLRG